MLKPWVAALSATLLMQTVGTFLSQAVPVVAPLMTAELGVRPEAIGNFASVNTLGAILFLLFGTPLVARYGPLRMLQAGALLGSLALLAAAAGIVWMLPFAALLMGIGYGPTGPAGSRILQATAPPRHRVLIFSVKQAGAPAGGALAGLVAAPVAAAYGWQAALLTAILVALACAALIQPLRPQLDAEREPGQSLRQAFTPRRLAAPVNVLRMHRVLPPLTLQAFAFAALQGSLFAFTVTWLVEAHGMGLAAAGSLFAAMQVAGVAGRLVLGWAADRLGDATRSLAIHGLVAAGLSALWVMFGPGAHWAVGLLLAVATGFTAASWNGIFLAEVARVAPPDRVAEASSGAILLCFLGYLSAPSAFAWAVTTTGSWTLPYFVACGLLAVVSLIVFALRAGREADSR
ncbi:MFS transporter [Falsiroseomonas tokyonensis]|uniref:MFS transporter n=1 Tax=Falsiroseomonas tokyonensis TaxID=430521 RepID=A0ABV7C164_9PROT|nr:MFS transporter [Falsiroseomonas tokyonensis]